MGLGFNGGQMIALAIGGCFCNDLRYLAEALGVELDRISVDVEIDLAGTPSLVTAARLTPLVTGRGDIAGLIARAASESTVASSVQRGFPVTVTTT